MLRVRQWTDVQLLIHPVASPLVAATSPPPRSEADAFRHVIFALAIVDPTALQELLAATSDGTDSTTPEDFLHALSRALDTRHSPTPRRSSVARASESGGIHIPPASVDALVPVPADGLEDDDGDLDQQQVTSNVMDRVRPLPLVSDGMDDAVTRFPDDGVAAEQLQTLVQHVPAAERGIDTTPPTRQKTALVDETPPAWVTPTDGGTVATNIIRAPSEVEAGGAPCVHILCEVVDASLVDPHFWPSMARSLGGMCVTANFGKARLCVRADAFKGIDSRGSSHLLVHGCRFVLVEPVL
uniref:Uncharacterized protein n=1 Tax=Neobodo designis TaxID=312471 RepID=A0A6U4XLZ5_NEODS|mmetsp:Transcript_54040/g.166250  ORF Transcript_54040/g.166250 Transcript_54040/m.166250 type:complete len:298 (+) Transcript_54040:44-937(+)